jgi:hypothetical protein
MKRVFLLILVVCLPIISACSSDSPTAPKIDQSNSVTVLDLRIHHLGGDMYSNRWGMSRGSTMSFTVETYMEGHLTQAFKDTTAVENSDPSSFAVQRVGWVSTYSGPSLYMTGASDRGYTVVTETYEVTNLKPGKTLLVFRSLRDKTKFDIMTIEVLPSGEKG